MATGSAKRLLRALNKASGRKKGLLVANARAHGDVYRTDLMTTGEVRELRQGVESEEERRSYNRMLAAEEVLRAHISNTQVQYQRLRERLAHLRGLFTLFRGQVFFEEYLTELSWGKTKGARALRERIGSSGRGCLFGVFGLREEDGYAFVDIAVSEEGKKLAREWISSATELMVTVKTMVEAAREFMEANDVHLAAYEDLLNGWEREIRELVRVTKRRLLPVDSEIWGEIRDSYVQSGEERLELVEALPEYESIAVDEGALDEMLASLDSDLNIS
jgi:hypothetical protein